MSDKSKVHAKLAIVLGDGTIHIVESELDLYDFDKAMARQVVIGALFAEIARLRAHGKFIDRWRT